MLAVRVDLYGVGEAQSASHGKPGLHGRSFTPVETPANDPSYALELQGLAGLMASRATAVVHHDNVGEVGTRLGHDGADRPRVVEGRHDHAGAKVSLHARSVCVPP